MTGFGSGPAHIENKWLWKVQQSVIVFWPIYFMALIAGVSFFAAGRPKLHTILLIVFGTFAVVLTGIFGLLLIFA